MGSLHIIMGVSGSGKTTIGKLLASTLAIPFYDADAFHPLANITKMASGHALTDTDRLPWLQTIATAIPNWMEQGAVLACSALKESYRDILHLPEYKDAIKFIFLDGDYDLIEKRLRKRTDHFFDNTLLQSQFETLEIPQQAIRVSIAATPEQVVHNIVAKVTSKSELGLIGLGVMGKSLSRNFARNGLSLSLYNRRVEGLEENVAKKFITEHDELHTAKGFEDIPQFVASLQRPRAIFLMVHAAVVDDVIAQLLPHLEPDDIIMDGGNSHFKDTERRISYLAEHQISFLGIGVSGGEEGALKGPSIMPGGTVNGYARVAPYLETIAAKGLGDTPCCSFVGNGGAGHFIKTIHNGIEYAEMQLIAEAYAILRYALHKESTDIADIFEEWNTGDLGSFLLEATIAILRHQEDGQLVLDVILDKAKQKGTGNWSTVAALELGQSFDTVTAALLARYISAEKDTRILANAQYQFTKTAAAIPIDTIRDGYAAARIINHAIGFETLSKASIAYYWDLKLGEIARLWTNGCIIRSVLMNDLVGILQDTPQLLLHTAISDRLKQTYTSLITTTTFGMQQQLATPVFSAALNYFNGFKTKDSVANLIQAQRDFFGAHTYERIDKAGVFHTNWNN